MRSANPVRERLVRAAAEHPDVIAVCTRTDSVTYAELLERVDKGVAALAGSGFAAGVPIALQLSESVVDVVRLLSVLSSAHPVMPLDAASPGARSAALIQEAGAAAYPGDHSLTTADVVREIPDTAVLMFTSGSTGAPKAVRQGFALWIPETDELRHELGITPGARVTQAMPVSFGGGLDITLTALLNGASLYLAHPRADGLGELLDSLVQWRPDSLHLSPTLLRAVVADTAATEALTGVRLVSTCGEPVDAAAVAALRERNRQVTFVNRSGSSESGNLTFNTFAPDRALPTGIIPAGRLADQKDVTVVDDDGTPVPAGTIGNLIVRSPFLAQGYLQDGEVTDFTTLTDGRREYRLGDRGHVVGDQLHLAGRADDTVKIRGYRVDISEVTGALHAIPEIAEAVVIARPGPAGTELVAYAAAAPGARPPSVAEIRTALAQSLPGWMQPAHVVLLPALPRGSRGKVDRLALPAPAGRPGYVAPGTRTECLLAPIWEDLLRTTDVGRDDDFLALGGDSLTAVELIARIDATFGITLSPSDLVSASTLRAVADVVDRHAPPTRGGVVVPLSAPAGPDDDRPLVFAFAGAGESALAFGPLARCLDGFRLVGLQAHALENRGIPDWTIGAAARRCVRHVQEISPAGPYRFAGHSVGAVIAIEVARILAAQGYTVEHIVCLDTIFTGPLGTWARFGLPGPPQTAAEPGQSWDEEDPLPARELWRRRLALLSAGWWPRPAKEQWSLFHELGRRSSLLHRLRPWHGPVTVILADDNPDNPDCWAAYTPNNVGVHRVSGDHTAMLRPPYVTRTAELVAGAFAGRSDVRP